MVDDVEREVERAIFRSEQERMKQPVTHDEYESDMQEMLDKLRELETAFEQLRQDFLFLKNYGWHR